MDEPWGVSAEDAILCQNGGMSHEKHWSDLHIYVESGVIISLVIHNITYTIPLVAHGPGLVHSTCVTWDFLNTYHMFFYEAIRVCTAQVTN